MNKAKLLEKLQRRIDDAPDGAEDYCAGLQEAIDLIEDLTCITDPTFPEAISEPVPLRDYGNLYLVKDASDNMYYVTRQDDWVFRNSSWKVIEREWTFYLNTYYPETRETK